MLASRSLRQLALVLVVSLLAACGGGSDDGSDTSNNPPTISIRIASAVPVTAVVTLDGSASSAAGGRTLTYNWVLTSQPAGSTATIVNPTTSQPTLTPDVVGTYNVTLTVSDGLQARSLPGTITASALTAPTIVADVVEPLSGSVQLTLSTDPGASTITWTADGTTLGTGVPLTWASSSVANGSHVIGARLQFAANYYYDISRTFQVTQTTVSFTGATVSQTSGMYTAITGAQSANGIVRVDATLDGVAVGSLTVPNACLDSTGAACATAGLNGYQFTGTAATGTHVVVFTATNGIGNHLSTQVFFAVS